WHNWLPAIAPPTPRTAAPMANPSHLWSGVGLENSGARTFPSTAVWRKYVWPPLGANCGAILWAQTGLAVAKPAAATIAYLRDIWSTVVSSETTIRDFRGVGIGIRLKRLPPRGPEERRVVRDYAMRPRAATRR